jgi:hypothetical protein
MLNLLEAPFLNTQPTTMIKTNYQSQQFGMAMSALNPKLSMSLGLDHPDPWELVTQTRLMCFPWPSELHHVGKIPSTIQNS